MAKDNSLFGQVFGEGGVFDKVFGTQTREARPQPLPDTIVRLNQQDLEQMARGRALRLTLEDGRKILIEFGDTIGIQALEALVDAKEDAILTAAERRVSRS
jgi:hypothetical protein